MTGGQANPTDRESLATRLESLGVREGTYHLYGAHLDDAMVMDRRAEGWVVFYSERGGECSLVAHGDEASACADLLARLTRDDHVFFDLVAGPALKTEADEAFDTWLQQRGIDRTTFNPADWKQDDVPWVPGQCRRRYFVRIAAIRRLNRAS